MFPFPTRNKMSDATELPSTPAPAASAHPLDALTGGAFSAATAGERAARIREWLTTQPEPAQLQEVFKELSSRDKGAARAVRERLDEIRRAKNQESIGAEWAEKANALLAASKLNIADAMAWQRDAAKAGAPLSREPLAGLKTALSERIKVIEDLQHRVQVQREAAVLLAQRIEVLSTKPWQDAHSAREALQADVQHWQEQAQQLTDDASWPSVEVRFPPLLDTSRAQLLVVWEAFQAAISQAAAAAADPQAPLPAVPMWADALRAARGEAPAAAEPSAARPARPRVDPAVVAQAAAQVGDALAKLEQETAQGHGKASVGAAAALRAVLKQHGRHIDTALEQRVHAALVAAGELEGWQRWSADQVREDLIAKAQSLLNRPEGQGLGGRKMQESLRQLREQWKQADQGGAPNHGLWKKFDEACNEAHKVVEAWLEKVRADAAEHRAQRMALIAELQTWGEQNVANTDWKAVLRGLQQFGARWREAGHVGEKLLAELQPQWKRAMDAAAAAFEAAQATSLTHRQAMIDEAVALGAAPMLRIDAVKALQQRWQAEAQSVPLERRHEQKLWDAFRKPIDEAFNRKTAEREHTAVQTSAHDKTVLAASKALEAANASGDAQAIRAAMASLEAALRGQAAHAAEQAVAQVSEPSVAATTTDTSTSGGSSSDATDAEAGAQSTSAEPADDAGADAQGESAPAQAQAPAPRAAPRPVIAVRGDDRPGMKKDVPAAPGRGARPGERRDARGPRDAGPGANRGAGRFGERAEFVDRGPRLGDAAFRAQREALEHAQAALRKLSAQAHGEALTHLLAAWEKRDASLVPPAQEFGRAVNGATRNVWTQAISQAPLTKTKTPATDLLLRLEIAAEVPTPAEQISARRMLQLQLLTRRNEAAPAETWTQDVAELLTTPSEAGAARRLQNALKALMRA